MAINYIGSDNITVFPAAKRVGYEESKRTTEDNLLKLNKLSSNADNLNQIFKDPDDNDNDYIIFNIHGYYFRCLETEIPAIANLTAYIKLENDPLNDIGWRLASTDDVVSALDDAGKFIGLAFTDDVVPEDEFSSEGVISKYYSIPATDESGNIIVQNLKLDSTEIRDGNADESIAEQFTTKALNVDGNVIINTSATTGAIFDVQADNVSKMRVIAPTGAVGIDTWLNVPSVYAITGQNDASVNLTEYGTTIERNVTDDMQPTLIINKKQGIGNIFKVDYNSDEQFSVKYNGTTWFKGSIYAPALLNQVLASNAGVYVQTTGTVINRDVADDNPALTVTQSNAGSTGNIAQFKSGETSKVIISKDGNVGIGVDNPSEKLEVDGNIVAAGDLTINKDPIPGNLIEANYNKVSKFTVDHNGIITATSLQALEGVNYAGIDVNDNGIRIAREIEGDIRPTLIVDKLTGTGNIIEIQYDSTSIATIDVDGNINTDGDVITTGNIYASSLLNTESGNSAKIDLTSVAGVTISNEDDVNHSTTLTVNKIEGNGNIIEAKYGSGDQPVKFSVDKDGNVEIAADAVYYGGGLYALNDPNNAMIELGTSGVSIARNIANHVPALTVSSFSGTGKILDVESGSTSRFAVNNNGDITVGDTTFTAAEISESKNNVLTGDEVLYSADHGTINKNYSLFSKRLVKANTYEVIYSGRIELTMSPDTNVNSTIVTLPEIDGLGYTLRYPNLQIRTQGIAVYPRENMYANISLGNNSFTITWSVDSEHDLISQDFDFSIRGIKNAT